MKLLRKIKFYHLTGKVMDPKVKKIIKMFDDICNNMEEYYLNDYPKSIFYKYNEKVYFELDLKNDITWCRYVDFWSKFESKFELNDMEIKKLTQYMLGTYLKREVSPTIGINNAFGRVGVPPTEIDFVNRSEFVFKNN